ncbi:MAG: phosphonopyruvate decarboxylase [bacterium]|nr:phosphonopyruvate decarboxylase [bacterium]
MKAKDIINILVKEKLLFLTGVSCSYLKHLLVYINSNSTPLQHIIATSEGEAVGISAGYYLATNKIPIIYLQNSGFGNTINPLTSLMDKEVYSIPAILFLTWRGEPGKKDEPQHKKMGRIMIDLLNNLEIPFEFASNNIKKTAILINKLKIKAEQDKKPVALIFRSNLIEEVKNNYKLSNVRSSFMTREEVLETLLPKIGKNLIVTTTGKTSRELFELREKLNQSHKTDFLTVGSMGCAPGIGLGIALQIKKKVFIIDGDGALLMKLGIIGTIGYYKPKKLIHIIIDNGAYESTGGQPTISNILNWKQLLKSTGYKNVLIVKSKKQLEKINFKKNNGPFAIVIFSKQGSRLNLGRPISNPIENKKIFMQFIKNKY